ncbi:hypothetical protein T459_35626 [Capsicum annuum]|uniref:Uncharacterized protein n=1 Tax=Capsicum annuum TaxID=4072 RepID=A0A2G2WP66_CAPAN|nr:hypothetical protein T459_35626 [Capsicum annuum]
MNVKIGSELTKTARKQNFGEQICNLFRVNGSNVVTFCGDGRSKKKTKITKNVLDPCSLSSSNNKSPNSASVLERATVGCFLVDQEMRLEPRKMQKPVVDRLVAEQPAQSESQ